MELDTALHYLDDHPWFAFAVGLGLTALAGRRIWRMHQPRTGTRHARSSRLSA